MTPIKALFYKEFRQHWILALGVVALCLFFQVACIVAAWFHDLGQIDNGFFIGSAFWLTVIYAGIAAALTYSTEHADKTFNFLRGLPVSQTMLAVGKIGWALCGTLLVFIGNVLISVLMMVMLRQVPDAKWIMQGLSEPDMWIVAGIILAEVFLWGLFWSTRCRHQMNAVLGSYASPICVLCGFAYIVVKVYGLNSTGAGKFLLYLNLAEIALVGFFAFWGVFHWFRYDARRSLVARLGLDQHIVFFRYPKTVQSPFWALVHQHIRHASLTYHFGILCFIVWSLGCIYLCCLSAADRAAIVLYSDSSYWTHYWWQTGYLTCVFGTFLFWGTIFGHDQRNDSYKFLTRMGVHAGKVWWSRMILPFSLYVFCGLCFLGLVLVDLSSTNPVKVMGVEWVWIPLLIVVWLAPVAVGSLVSISFRSQALAVLLTWIGMYALVLWAANWMIRYESSPVWTTLPICITLLVASRMRATYLFREMFTWRSRIIPLVPVLGTVLVVASALWCVDICWGDRTTSPTWLVGTPTLDGSDSPHPNPLPEGEGTKYNPLTL